jgi:hypothetical protein
MPTAQDRAIRYLFHGSVLHRNLAIALIVGVALSAVNQGDVLMNGDLSARVWIKVLFNFFVPFTVASVSCVVNRSRR